MQLVESRTTTTISMQSAPAQVSESPAPSTRGRSSRGRTDRVRRGRARGTPTQAAGPQTLLPSEPSQSAGAPTNASSHTPPVARNGHGRGSGRSRGRGRGQFAPRGRGAGRGQAYLPIVPGTHRAFGGHLTTAGQDVTNEASVPTPAPLNVDAPAFVPGQPLVQQPK
jgi:hypothetical protein